MTTLQEAEQILNRLELFVHGLGKAILQELRVALAQHRDQQPVAWYEYNQDLDAWFLAYGHNPKAKTRPLVFGDTAAPAPQAQDKSDNYLSGYCTGRTDLLKEQSAQPAQGVPEVGFGNMQSAQPVAQQDHIPDAGEMVLSDDEILTIAHRKATRYTHAVAPRQVTYGFAVAHLLDFVRAVLEEKTAQPVAQPLPDPCHTCAHYQQGKLPGVRIHDETCYECRSYWGNKWEAA